MVHKDSIVPMMHVREGERSGSFPNSAVRSLNLLIYFYGASGNLQMKSSVSVPLHPIIY